MHDAFKPGTLIVLSNKRWKPTQGTPWEGLEKERSFQKYLKPLKLGRSINYHDHAFMIVGELQKAAA